MSKRQLECAWNGLCCLAEVSGSTWGEILDELKGTIFSEEEASQIKEYAES